MKKRGTEKLQLILVDSGYLVLLWHVPTNSNVPEIEKAYDLLWEYYPEKKAKTTNRMDINYQRKKEIMDSGYFVVSDYLEYKWKLEESMG